MPSTWDLDVDTYWIRRAAGSVDEAARCFGAVAGDRSWVPVSVDDLGRCPSAAAVVVMVDARNSQAHAAAAQLRSLADAVGLGLLGAADRFDRTEVSVGSGPR